MIVKIEAYDNGAHANQSTTPKIIPEGWAVVPDYMELPNFPFGEVEAEEIDGVMTVTRWTAGVIPETEPEQPESSTEEVTWEAMAKAITEGVNEI